MGEEGPPCGEQFQGQNVTVAVILPSSPFFIASTPPRIYKVPNRPYYGMRYGGYKQPIVDLGSRFAARTLQ